MTFRRLISQIDQLSGDGDVRSLRNDKGIPAGFTRDMLDSSKVFVVEGTVRTVYGNGTYEVAVFGIPRECSATTDEPIRAGQVVYVSRTVDGNFIVHGSAG